MYAPLALISRGKNIGMKPRGEAARFGANFMFLAIERPSIEALQRVAISSKELSGSCPGPVVFKHFVF